MSNFQIFDYEFKNEKLLEVALTHKSFAFEFNREKPLHNEKLEFLGDAVLDLILSDLLMNEFPENDEGDLSKKRAHLVNEQGLALQAEKLALSSKLRLGKGELQSGGGQKPRLMASSFEAVVGALYTEAGFEVCRQIVQKIFAPQIAELKENPEFDQDFKSKLQELMQGMGKKAPLYELKSQLGPAHDRVFEVQVLMDEHVLATAFGKTKKAAEQSAARQGLESFRLLNQATKGERI